MGDSNEVQQGGTVTEALPQTTVAGGKAKGKNAKTGNLIFDIAKEVEGLGKTKALNRAEELASNVEETYFELGGVLNLIKENKWFDGFPDFGEYVFEKFGFQSRKADYLIDIFKGLVNTQIPWEKVQHLGWTKLKDLVKVPLTLENLDEWIAKADACTVAELQAAIKAAKGGGDEEGDTSVKSKDDITTVKIKFHNDQLATYQQGIAKGKGELHTEFDAVVVENVMSAYIGGTIGVPQQEPDIAAILKEMGIQAVADVLDKVFPEYDISIDEATPESQDTASAVA